MSDVLDFPGRETTHVSVSPRKREIEAEAVAKGAVEYAPKLDQLLVLGITHDGQLYAAATHPDVADNVLLLERMKRKLMLPLGDDEFAP